MEFLEGNERIIAIIVLIVLLLLIYLDVTHTERVEALKEKKKASNLYLSSYKKLKEDAVKNPVSITEDEHPF